MLNLLRLEAEVGYRIDTPLPRQAIFDLIASRAAVEEAELNEVFNLGCGFCCVVPAGQADDALRMLGEHHPGAAVIGEVTDVAGVVELPGVGLVGRRDQGFAPSA